MTRRADARRLPAEWEPHRATWLTWPHNAETWPGVHAAAIAAFRALVRALRRFEPLRVLVPDAALAREVERSRELGGDFPLEVLVIPTNDSWTRDFGPICVETPAGALATDWRFDAWGGKYPPWDADDRAARAMCEHASLAREELDAVLEGGSIDGDGRGTLLATESCLLARGRTREAWEELLGAALGATRILWLGDGIAGDDTDGHVDDFARFVSLGRVITATQPDRSDPDHAPLARNFAALEALRAAGVLREVIELPMPEPVFYRGARLPASYANFYFVNGGLIVPIFRSRRDDAALGILRELFPDRDVAGVDCRELVVGLGGVHCLSMQEPAMG